MLNTVKEIVTHCKKALKDVQCDADLYAAVDQLTSDFKAAGWLVDGGMFKRVFLRGKYAVKVGWLDHDRKLYSALRRNGHKKLCPRDYYRSKYFMIQQRMPGVGFRFMSRKQKREIYYIQEDLNSETDIHVSDLHSDNLGVLGNRIKIIDGICKIGRERYSNAVSEEERDRDRMGGHYESSTRLDYLGQGSGKWNTPKRKYRV